MNWYITSIGAIILFSAANAIARLFQNRINPFFALVVQVIGAFITAGIVVLLYKTLSAKDGIVTTQGILIALVAGIVWAGGQLLLYITLSKSAPLSIVMPLIVGGIGMGGVIAGVGFFSEQLTLLRIVGITLILAGSIILARS